MDFTWYPTYPSTTAAVKFTNTSSESGTYVWDFGDGTATPMVPINFSDSWVRSYGTVNRDSNNNAILVGNTAATMLYNRINTILFPAGSYIVVQYRSTEVHSQPENGSIHLDTYRTKNQFYRLTYDMQPHTCAARQAFEQETNSIRLSSSTMYSLLIDKIYLVNANISTDTVSHTYSAEGNYTVTLFNIDTGEKLQKTITVSNTASLIAASAEVSTTVLISSPKKTYAINTPLNFRIFNISCGVNSSYFYYSYIVTNTTTGVSVSNTEVGIALNGRTTLDPINISFTPASLGDYQVVFTMRNDVGSTITPTFQFKVIAIPSLSVDFTWTKHSGNDVYKNKTFTITPVITASSGLPIASVNWSFSPYPAYVADSGSSKDVQINTATTVTILVKSSLDNGLQASKSYTITPIDEAPVPISVNFSASPTLGYSPQIVTFSPVISTTSTKPYTVTFAYKAQGDTNYTSFHTGMAPFTYTFNKGVYSIKATASYDDGSASYEKELTNYLTVLDAQVPINMSFLATPEIAYLDEVIRFTNLSTGPKFWYWDLGDGHTAITENVSNMYGTPAQIIGNHDNTLSPYTVTLKGSQYSQPPCDTEHAVSKTIRIINGLKPENLVASITISSVTGPEPLSVTITDYSIGSPDNVYVMWDYGNSSTVEHYDTTSGTIPKTFIHTYSEIGEYVISYQITRETPRGTESSTVRRTIDVVGNEKLMLYIGW